jgi:hypothetical protein
MQTDKYKKRRKNRILEKWDLEAEIIPKLAKGWLSMNL